MLKSKKIIITGAAGLVGQNLILLLCEQGYTNIVAIDKNKKNLNILKKLNNSITIVESDLSEKTDWQNHFTDSAVVIMLHAQITSLFLAEYVKNNVIATRNVLSVMKQNNIKYMVHISSSVINSVATDDYTRTKREQENIVMNSGVSYCILRPTLMFGWFDSKHLGWLSRFMKKTPLFPIPGNGKYIRQPLYSRDFCKIIIIAIEKKINNKIYDIIGLEKIYYIDIIKAIKKIIKAKTRIVKIPYLLFFYFLKLYAFIFKKPPFTADQLTALTAGDDFIGIDYEKEFNIQATPLLKAFKETYTHQHYSKITLDR